MMGAKFKTVGKKGGGVMKNCIPLDTIKNQSSGLWYFSFAELFVDDSIIYRGKHLYSETNQE